MNISLCDGELEIYDKTQFIDGTQEPRMTMWHFGMNHTEAATQFCFIIAPDCELTEEMVEGRKHYILRRKK